MCAVVLNPAATTVQSTLIGILFVLLSTVFAQGCAIHEVYFGRTGTDLSSLHPGASRTAIEKVIGPPEQIEQGEGVHLARYIYDMGYVGAHEEDSAASKIVSVPAAITVDVMTFGTVEAAEAILAHCKDVCQKGLLAVCYDASDSMLSARESLLPESHPLLNGCLYGPGSGRSHYNACEFTRQQAVVSNNIEDHDSEWFLDKVSGTYCPNADLGHADAQLQIGNIYNQRAFGRKIDPVRAWVWYSLAAQGGNEHAAELLSIVTLELTPEQQVQAIQQLAAWQPGQCAQELLILKSSRQTLTTQYPSTISASTCMAWQAEKEEQKRRNSHRGHVGGQ